jgi:hypothetical protein
MSSLDAIKQKEKELEELKQAAINELLQQRELIDEQLRELGYGKRGRGSNGKVKTQRKRKARAETS